MLYLKQKIAEFDAFVREKDCLGADDPLSFADPNRYLWKEETEFKHQTYHKAQEALALDSWARSDIGTGKIAEKVKGAVNCDNHGLIHRNQKKSLLAVLEDHSLYHETERFLYDLYRMEKDPQVVEELISIFSRRYDVISYLLFIKDDMRYLPVKSYIFDKCLKQLGADYQLSGRCGWENFKGFMDLLRSIADELNRSLKMEPKATLMDAHSFLWILGNQMVQKREEDAWPEFEEYREIFVGDGILYKSQRQIALFFHKDVRVTGGEVKLNQKYVLWFIRLNHKDADWQNEVTSDGLSVIETNRKKPHKDEKQEGYRITFANFDGKGFRFLGVFQLEGCGDKPYLERIYQRVGASFDTGDLENTAQFEAQSDYVSKVEDIADISQTERAALIKNRIGQGTFRNRLQGKYHACALCGMTNPKLLVASHIKEWKDSAGGERLDENNGLLLCTTHDALFDKHLISFDEKGYILISKEISDDDRKRCGIDADMRINMNAVMAKYMEHHRARFYASQEGE